MRRLNEFENTEYLYIPERKAAIQGNFVETILRGIPAIPPQDYQSPHEGFAMKSNHATVYYKADKPPKCPQPCTSCLDCPDTKEHPACDYKGWE